MARPYDPTNTANSAKPTHATVARRRRRCARCIAPATRRLSTSPARGRILVDPRTGEIVEVELYVAVLGASNYTYADATRTQQLADFVGATVRAFEYFDAVSSVVVPDQLRSAVKVPCRYEPEINATFAELGRHYGCAIIPARPRKPRDKAKVEVGVQIAQRRILACPRHCTFFSLDELNAAIAELLEKLNARPFAKGLDGCRRNAFRPSTVRR